MKRKIKDFKDFLDCIKAGKKVTSDYGYWTYFFSNGYICKSCDNLNAYNLPINGRDLEEMEVEEQEQLRFEVGKFYRTRDGRRAYCFSKIEGTLYPNHCAIDGESGFNTYTDGGLDFSDEENPEDIIGYWEE